MNVIVNNIKLVVNEETFEPNKVIDITIELPVEFLADSKIIGGDAYKECCRKIGEMIIDKTNVFKKRRE